MNKKLFTTFAAIAASVMIPSSSTHFAAIAQGAAPNTISCLAESPSAWGQGTGYGRNAACSMALYQCSIRTPYNQVCTVTKWWVN